MGSDFATNGEQTATNPFAVYGERTQLVIDLGRKDIHEQVANSCISIQSWHISHRVMEISLF